MPTIITVSGQPGSGTTTLTEKLESRLDATYLNAGSIFRSLADDHGMSLETFSKHVNENPEIDRAIDHQLRVIVDEYLGLEKTTSMPEEAPEIPDFQDSVDMDAEYLILESRLAGWIAGIDAAVRIWCQAPIEVRCERLSDSGNLNAETSQELIDRQSDEAMRYKQWYDIEITDTSIYDLVLNTSRWSPDVLMEIVLTGVLTPTLGDDEGATPTESPFTPHSQKY